jgi:hypothetical protein
MLQLESQTKDSYSGVRFQPKLKIGQPGDKYEQEADAVADRVMSMSESETMQMQPVDEDEDDSIQMFPAEDKSQIAGIKQFTENHLNIQCYADPILWCDALMTLVEYEEQHGKLNTLVEYHSFDHDDLIPLNYNIPSIYGEVDVDWMFRLAVVQYPFIIGSIFTPSMSEGFGSLASHAMYVLLKSFWIAIDPRTDQWNWDSLTEEGNWNSSSVIIRWIHGQETLRDIFAPALPLCENLTGGTSDTREPTY